MACNLNLFSHSTKQNVLPVLQSNTLAMHAKRAQSLTLNVQRLHFQGIKTTCILCLPSDGTNRTTSFCPAVKWTSPRTLAKGDFSQLLAAKLCASASSICTSVEEALFCIHVVINDYPLHLPFPPILHSYMPSHSKYPLLLHEINMQC